MDWLERVSNVIDKLSRLSRKVLPILGVTALLGVLLILDDIKGAMKGISSGYLTLRISSIPEVTLSENSRVNIRPFSYTDTYNVVVQDVVEVVVQDVVEVDAKTVVTTPYPIEIFGRVDTE